MGPMCRYLLATLVVVAVSAVIVMFPGAPQTEATWQPPICGSIYALCLQTCLALSK